MYRKSLTFFFHRLFKAHPETQKEFKAFNGRDPDTLRENSRMAAHSLPVMSAISNIVDNLNDPSTLVEILKTTGKNHYKRGINKDYFAVRNFVRTFHFFQIIQQSTGYIHIIIINVYMAARSSFWFRPRPQPCRWEAECLR